MSNQQQKQRLDELKQYSVPSVEYWWLPGSEQAISKLYVKYSTPTFIITGIVLTLLTEHTNFWMILGTGFWNLAFVKLWYITLPAIGVGFLYVYVKDRGKQKRRIAQQQVEARRKKLDELIG